MAARGASAQQAIELTDNESTASDLDDDDAVAGPSRPRRLKIEPRTTSEPRDVLGTKRRRPSGGSNDEVAVKVEWTDDSDGEYERLKKRKKSGSGRGRGGKKKADGRGKNKDTAAGPSNRRTSGGARASSRGRGGGRRQFRTMKNSGVLNDDSDTDDNKPNRHSDNEDEDSGIPDYLRRRQQEFESRHAKLCEAGLRLPPNYTDVYFSDDDMTADGRGRRRRREPLQERPQFGNSVRPSREKKDIVLQYSAGIIPGSIAQYLRDYQITGVQFLHRLFVYQRGGVLGDDMGLGKTVQVAAFLAAAFGKTGDERDAKRMRKMRRAAAAEGVDDSHVEGHEAGEGGSNISEAAHRWWYPVVLIVCPGSLIQNWRNELQRWGWWHVDLYHGSGKDDVLQAARAGRLEIMVTTYATYKNHRARINRVRWDVVVADECHVLKERGSETTRAMDEVNALCRIGLTGTAIQNRYEELWTLLNWTNPGRFGTLAEWRQTISRPLTIGQSHDATLYQLSLARRTAKKLVQNLLPDFFLRRMKSLIAHQLPRKTDRVVFCPLTERQSVAYENFIESEQVNFLRSVSEECDCGSGNKRGWCCYKHVPGSDTTWFSLVFPTIQSLLKLANHLTLLIPAADSGVSATMTTSGDTTAGEPNGQPTTAARAAAEKFERAMNVLRTCVPDDWASLYRNRDSLVNLANPEFCGKWKVLRKLLRFWHENGDKVLIFSHTVRLLRILQHLFSNTSYSASYLDGSLSYEERQRVVDDFNSDPAQFVFLISTKAGGVGLNITSANKVVIFDPHWNPAYDLQAQDRAYRIGQVRDVDVFRLVSAGTIEEIVYARQIYKQQQANIGYSASTERRYFRGVQQDSERKGEIFGLNNLFIFHHDQVVLRDIVNKTNIAEAKAGVRLTDIDMDKAANDNETDVLAKIEGGHGAGSGEAALSQLAEGLDGGEENKPKKDSQHGNEPVGSSDGKPKSDAIQAILASAGVEYTHDNSEVIGSSRVEAQLSRRAEMVVGDDEDGEYDLDGGETEDDEEDDDDLDGHHPHDVSATEISMLLADTSAAFDTAGDTDALLVNRGQGSDNRHPHNHQGLPAHLRRLLRYNPPVDAMRRQFCTMAHEAGFATATEFAMVVESWTPEQRRTCLEGFYRRREARVSEIEEKEEKAAAAAAEAEQAEALVREQAAIKREEDFTVRSENERIEVKTETRAVKKELEEDSMLPIRKIKEENDDEVVVLPPVKQENTGNNTELTLPRIKKEPDTEEPEQDSIQILPPVKIKGEPDVADISMDALEAPPVANESSYGDSHEMVILSSSPVMAPVKTEPRTDPHVTNLYNDDDDDDETDEL